MVKLKDTRRFVYVLPKFIIGDNEQIEIEIRETKGNRRITLHLKEKRSGGNEINIINNIPSPFQRREERFFRKKEKS